MRARYRELAEDQVDEVLSPSRRFMTAYSGYSGSRGIILGLAPKAPWLLEDRQVARRDHRFGRSLAAPTSSPTAPISPDRTPARPRPSAPNCSRL